MLAQRAADFNRAATGPSIALMNGSSLVACADLLMIPTGLLIVGLLTRGLGPHGYGLFALSASLIAGVEWGLASILARPTIHSVGQATDWRPVARTLLMWHLALAMGVSFILWLTARPLATLLGEPTLVSYLFLFACDVPLFLLAQAYRNILTARGQFAARAVTGASRWVVRLALMAIAVRWGLSIPLAIVATIGASMVELAMGRWIVGPVGSQGTSRAKALQRLAFPLVLSAAAMMVVSKIDLFMTRILGLSVDETGLYAAAQNLTVLPGIFGQAVAAVLLSMLTYYKREAEVALFRETARQSLLLCLSLLPVVAVVAGAAEGIVFVCFGPAFQAAAPLVSLLISGAVAQVFIGMGLAILAADGRGLWAVVLTSPLALIAVGGHLWMIPIWGSMGAALTTTITMMIGAGALSFAVRNICLVRLLWGSLARALIFSGLGWYLARITPREFFWLVMGLPALAVLLTGCYGRWEGLIGGEWLTYMWRSVWRRSPEIPWKAGM